MYAKHVKVPTMMAQLCRDFLVHAEADGQAIFNALGADEKELLGLRNSASVSTLTTISVSILNGCSAGSPSTCDRRRLNHALEPGLGGRGAWHQSGAEGAVHRCDVRRRARRRYPDFYQSAFSGVDPNDFTQLCPYLRRKNPARDSFRGACGFRRLAGKHVRRNYSAKPIFNAVDGARERIV